nr:MAG TPA: hypothetical protein [Caudoviricetes sp.]
MATCEKCIHFERQETRLYCKRQKTHCAVIKKADLGRGLKGCRYEKKEEKENVQS